MSTVGWLVAAVAVASALALPFSRGAAMVLALTPFMNAYGAAAATAVVVGRWAIMDLSSRKISRSHLRWLCTVVAFVLGAVVLSGLVAQDLLRFASESAQWLVGVGLFCAVLVGGRGAHERPVILGMVAGGLAMALAHVFMRTLELTVDETAVMPFMISTDNNYAALYALVALVILPAHPSAKISTPIYLLISAMGVMVTILQDSRAQMLIAGGVMGMVVLLRHLKPRVALATLGIAAALVAFVAAHYLRESLFSSQSLVSLANFQTNFSNLERLGLLLHSMDFFSSNPLGAGLGASSSVFPDSPFTIGSYPSPHNTFALMIVESGWWGLFAYLAGTCALLFIGARDCLAGRAFGIAAMAAVGLSVVDAVFFNGSVSLVFWLLMAYIVRNSSAENGERIPMQFQRVV
jgi:hypothetical protein